MNEQKRPTITEEDAAMIDELIDEFKKMARDPKVLEEAEELHRRGIPSPEELLRKFTI